MPFGDCHKKQRPTRTTHCSDMNVNKIWENQTETGRCMDQELKWSPRRYPVQCSCVLGWACHCLLFLWVRQGIEIVWLPFLSFLFLSSLFLSCFWSGGGSVHRLCAPWNHELYMYKCFGSRIGTILHIKYYWHLCRWNFPVSTLEAKGQC